MSGTPTPITAPPRKGLFRNEHLGLALGIAAAIVLSLCSGAMNRYDVGVLTDIGTTTRHVEASLSGCDALVLECNHDVDMLANGDYPYPLKQRIAGKHRQRLAKYLVAGRSAAPQVVVIHRRQIVVDQ